MASEVKTNKISPATGRDGALGDSSDTFTLPSGSAITVASGGDINVASGGEIDIASDATLDVNGTIDVTGATVTGLTTGALVHLHTTTVDAVVSEIQCNDVFSATYSNYRILLNNLVPDTDNNTIYLGFKETSGATQLNMTSISRFFGTNASGGTEYNDSTEYNMGGQELTKTASADGGVNGWIEVFLPFVSGGSNWTRTTYAFMNYNPLGGGSTAGWGHTYGAAQATATTSTPCFRLFSSGDIGDATITGYVRVYGYKDS